MGLAVDNPMCCITHRDVVTEPLRPCLGIRRNTDFLARDHHPRRWEANTGFFLHLMALVNLHIPITLYTVPLPVPRIGLMNWETACTNKTLGYSPMSKCLHQLKKQHDIMDLKIDYAIYWLFDFGKLPYPICKMGLVITVFSCCWNDGQCNWST